MGSDISQSQQVRNTFPISQYKMLPNDNNFSQCSIIQRLSDNSTYLACCVSNSNKTDLLQHKNILKRTQKRQLNNKTFELYQWATTNVQGLVEYIQLIDKNRKISKTQYKAIVQGCVRGYSQIALSSQNMDCLQIKMQNLRIFNQISLKTTQSNTKQVVNSVVVKILPKSLNHLSKAKESQKMKWANVTQCIHRGGILKQRQLLGQYLLQLSNYATKMSFSNKQQSLKNLNQHFGSPTVNVVEGLLANQEWKQIVKIFVTKGTKQKSKNQTKQHLKNISNNKVFDFQKPSQKTLPSQKNHQLTRKTIDSNNERENQSQLTTKTIQTGGKTQKSLFKNFKTSQQQNKDIIPYVHTRRNSIQNNLPRLNKANPQINLRSVSPLRTQKYFSPPSIKMIPQSAISKIIKNSEYSQTLRPQLPKIQRVNSILTMYPDILKEEEKQRSRIISTKQLRSNKFFSPQLPKTNMYVSPPKAQNKQPKIIYQQPKIIYQQPKIIYQQQKMIYQQPNMIYQQPKMIYQQSNYIEKRKGKPISFLTSKPTLTLKTVHIDDYYPKIMPDIYQQNKNKNKDRNARQTEMNNHFLQDQFNGLQFSLSDKYFNTNKKLPSSNVDLKLNSVIKSPIINKHQQEKKNPISYQKNPISKQKNPMSYQNSPISYQKSPLSNQKSPISNYQNKRLQQKLNMEPISHINYTHNNSFGGHSHLKPLSSIDNTAKVPLLNNHCIKKQVQPFSITQVDSQTILVEPYEQYTYRKTNNNSINQNNNNQNLYNNQNINKNKPELHKQTKQAKYIGPVNLKGQKQGNGKLYFTSGGFYIGGFFKDFMHGQGKLYYAPGKLAYQGSFRYDKFHGMGKLYNQNPSYIQAFDFRNFNKLQVTQKQQPIHRQHFLINPIQRQQKISYWKYYQGQMNYDMKHGKGILMFQNGQTYQGEFKDDLVMGKGVFYGQNGKITGRWEDNLLMQVYR